jgi:serine/threonine-protein kinase
MTQWAFRRETCTCLPVLTNPRSEPETAQALFVNPPLLTAGSKIGRHYQVISFIGEGGASAVYKVKHQHLEKEFAVKVLLPNRIPTGSMLKRFQQEGRSIGRLKHKHIVSVHEFGVDENNQPFLVMDYLEGKTLSDLIKDTGGLEPIRAAAIFQQIAEALEHAHANSVIHRDLKPNNVIIVHDEKGQETVKLVDFGIAKLEEEASLQDTLTKTGEIFGSPHYMSPEQCKGRALDARADVYSFGCLMYETLTGTPAAQADTVFDILMLHLKWATPRSCAAKTDAWQVFALHNLAVAIETTSTTDDLPILSTTATSHSTHCHKNQIKGKRQLKGVFTTSNRVRFL